MELLIVIISMVLVYFAIVKFTGLTEMAEEKIGENQAKDLVNEHLGNDWCFRATLSPFTASFADDTTNDDAINILTACVKIKGIKKDYACLIDSDSIVDIKLGARYLANMIKNDIAQEGITC